MSRFKIRGSWWCQKGVGPLQGSDIGLGGSGGPIWFLVTLWLACFPSKFSFWLSCRFQFNIGSGANWPTALGNDLGKACLGDGIRRTSSLH